MRTVSRIAVAVLLAGVASTVALEAQEKTPKPVPLLREQAKIRLTWTKQRLETVLPALMRKHGVEMWIVLCREYNEDPVFFSIVAPTTFAARRTTIYVFYDRGPEKGVERLALGGSSQGGLYTVYRDPEVENRELWGSAQWVTLRKLVEERNPKTIGVNISATHAFSDGLSAGLRDALEDALGAKWTSRFVRAEGLPLEFVAVRAPEMLPAYRRMQETVHSLIGRAFSNEVIKPGTTTNNDVVWWLRQQVNDLGLGTWFHPTVRVQRQGLKPDSPIGQTDDVVIQRGDVLHVDFGITAMGLATDTQHMAYVLGEGEAEPPAGVRKALENSNRLQDLLMARIRPGRSGNEVLMDTLAAMTALGIKGSVYTHPIGDHGHGAGPTIGLWDRQMQIPGKGDVLVLPNMWFSIELSATTAVPEWGGQDLWVGQEEDAVLVGDKIEWALRRQTKYHLVK